MFIDYYALLEVSEFASLEEIKKAFRDQATKWHPDRNPGIDSTKRMQEINEAYLMLKDKEARERYDIEYRRFKGFYQQKSQNREESKQKDTRSRNENEKSGSNTKYEYTDYTFEDNILKKWMDNARKQAIDLAQQTIQNLKGVTVAATSGCFDGIIQLVVYGVIINIIFLMVKSCN